MLIRLKWSVVVLLLILAACSKNKNQEAQVPERIVDVPKSNSDSAYSFVKKQVAFGPRVPNSKAHRQTGEYLINTLKHFGAAATTQDFESQSYDGQKLYLRNIIASFYPEKQKRVLLAAHWDTRPFADKDKLNPNAPFDGANDGASGVGVLLEVARVLKNNKAPEVGIDIIFFDGEDWGEPDSVNYPSPLPPGLREWWCLGSQYWAAHKHKPNYAAYYGILLDMVGAQGAKFYREGFSRDYAPSIVDRIWNRAAKLGYSQIFVPQNVASITDDHLFVNEIARIPMVDIVQYDPAFGYFGDYHHTQKDNLDLISAQTLQIVTDVVLNVIYYEQ
jgi:Zn-dependent M28 family amino/carboxypeptidase